MDYGAYENIKAGKMFIIRPLFHIWQFFDWINKDLKYQARTKVLILYRIDFVIIVYTLLGMFFLNICLIKYSKNIVSHAKTSVAFPENLPTTPRGC